MRIGAFMAAEKLKQYRAKRNFAKTSEPSGASGRQHAGRSFVIQQHAARRMHYDFRLELYGPCQRGSRSSSAIHGAISMP
jgi:hypothetical protein